MLLSGHKLKLPCGNTSLKPGANFRVCRFTHAASQRIAVKVAFVGDGFALKAAVAGIGDSLPCDLLRTLPVMLGRMFLTRLRASVTTLSAWLPNSAAICR